MDSFDITTSRAISFDCWVLVIRPNTGRSTTDASDWKLISRDSAEKLRIFEYCRPDAKAVRNTTLSVR